MQCRDGGDGIDSAAVREVPRHDTATALAAALVEQSVANAERVAAALLDDPELVAPFIEALRTLSDPHDSDDRTHLARSLLATPGREALTVVAALAASATQSAPRTGDAFCTFPYERDAVVAEMVALRPTAELFDFIADGAGGSADPDTALRLIHHLVALGRPVPDAARWPLRWAVDTDHPLAALPTHLLEIERHLPHFIRRSFDPVGADTGWTYPTEQRPLSDLLPGFGSRAPVDPQRVTAAVRDWPLLSNGRLHVDSWRPGNLDAPAQGQASDEHGSTFQTRISLADPATALPAEFAVSLIFAAASSGPAYGGTPGPGPARIRMWESVAGLTGAAWPSPIERVADAARATTWIGLPAEGYLWRIRLLAARADRLVLLDAYDVD